MDPFAKTSIGRGDKTASGSMGHADGMIVGPKHPMFQQTSSGNSINSTNPIFPDQPSNVRFSQILPGTNAAGPDNDVMKL